MADTEIAVVEQLPAPAPVDAPVEPPHTLPGTALESAPVDDDAPLDDVVDEDSHRPSHRGSRAKSKMAAARINRLTAERNELRQRLEAVEKAQKASPQAQPKPPVYQVPAVPTEAFKEPEPKLDDFANEEDPYGAWILEKAEWRARKRDHEAVRSHQESHVQALSKQQEEYWQGVTLTHKGKLMAAVQAKPELLQVLQQADSAVQLPTILDRAIMLDDDSVSVAVFLASHQDALDDLVSRAVALPPTEQSVALLRRLVRQRMSAGTTGSVPPAKSTPAPRPPNPVRTGTIRTGNEPPPEGSSIADHAKYWQPKR